MQSINIKISLLLLLFIAVTSCNDEGTGMSNNDSFDRQEMLAFWADDIIIPAYESHVANLQELESTASQFFNDANEENYDLLVGTWLSAYKSWQSVSMFDIGKAEEIKLRNFTNIFPVDTALINSNIQYQSYNLELPSNYDVQGFPALDYLLFGLAENKVDIISTLTRPEYKHYLNDVVSRLNTLTTTVLEDWKTGYRNVFVENNGSSATASVDKMVNDFIFYYEKFFRAGKVGIPAGVFSGSPISYTVEAPYSEIYTKALWQASFSAVKDFFNGVPFAGGNEGISLKSYINYVKAQNNLTDIVGSINSQWDVVENSSIDISDSFKSQVETDNNKMLALYDELQKAVVILKVDMMQALNIQIDYVDADGD